jgi:predicted Zn-dependent peptidase
MKPHLHTLKNQIPVITIPETHAPSVTLMVFVKVGSRYEERETNGVSHFIEHLLFKGTKRRPSPMAISHELDRYGAEFNAFTGKDLTAYYIKIDASQTPLAIDLLHDMLFHSLFDAKELNRERGVIVEEINMYEDNPRMHIDDLLEKALFPESTLGWQITGPREVIKTVPREKIIAYKKRYYVPSRLTIAASGNIPDHLLPLLEKTFGQIKEPKTTRNQSFKPFIPPAIIEQPIAFQSKATEQVQLGIAYYGLPHGHPSMPAMSLLATILGGSMSSRLFTEVREKRGLCYSIGASHQAMEDIGIFSVMAGLEKGRLAQAIGVIKREIMRLTTTPITKQELQSAKDHIRGKLKLAFEDSSTAADWYGKQWIFRHVSESPEDRLVRIDQVTAAEIRSLAKTIFRPEHMAASVIGPFSHQKEIERLLRR